MSADTRPGPTAVDVRGPRFAAWVTTAVLTVVLLITTVSIPAAAAILGLQMVVFTVGALLGPRRHPYGRVFSVFVAPRIGPVTEREPEMPLRFAQAVGLAFAAAGTAGFAFGVPAVGLVATAFALFAAFLNAAFGLCLGCQIYPFVARLRRATPATT
jgi:Domain of unknown function (DUF4395)